MADRVDGAAVLISLAREGGARVSVGSYHPGRKSELLHHTNSSRSTLSRLCVCVRNTRVLERLSPSLSRARSLSLFLSLFLSLSHTREREREIVRLKLAPPCVCVCVCARARVFAYPDTQARSQKACFAHDDFDHEHAANSHLCIYLLRGIAHGASCQVKSLLTSSASENDASALPTSPRSFPSRRKSAFW